MKLLAKRTKTILIHCAHATYLKISIEVVKIVWKVFCANPIIVELFSAPQSITIACLARDFAPSDRVHAAQHCHTATG